jgi:hypothetical protein
MRNYDVYFDQKRGEVRKQRKMISDVLAKGPAKVGTIAQATGMPLDLIVWNLVGMLRWGEVDVKGEDHHELIYALKEV